MLTNTSTVDFAGLMCIIRNALVNNKQVKGWKLLNFHSHFNGGKIIANKDSSKRKQSLPIFCRNSVSL